MVSKSVNPDRVISNFKIFDWALSPQDMASFDQINCGWRHLLWGETSHHPNYPFRVLPLTRRLVSFDGAGILNYFSDALSVSPISRNCVSSTKQNMWILEYWM